MQSAIIRIGGFFFKARNAAFPLLIVAIFAIAAPPHTVFNSALTEIVTDWLAVAIVLFGLVVRATVIGYAYIQRGGRNKRVYAKRLVTGGMFQLCRNPLYVGNMLIYFGLFLMHGNPVVIVVGTCVFAFIYYSIVRTEEAFLLDKFGAEYRRYCADVPRWLPKISRFGQARVGMRFNFERVLVKDYSTIGITIIALALTEAYENTGQSLSALDSTNIDAALAVVAATVVWICCVRFLKKRRIIVPDRARAAQS